MNSKGPKNDPIKDDALKVAADPFATLADPDPVKKPVAKKAAAPSKPAARPAKAKTLETKAVDAFEEPAAEFTLDAQPKIKRASSRAKRSAKASVKPAAKKAAGAAQKVTSKKTATPTTTVDAAQTAQTEAEVSPVFKALAEPVLPALENENRARLLMQSPTRVYFYWSVKENPYQMLREAFGKDTGSYTLVLKLTDLKRDTEVLVPADVSGEYWFDVEPDGEYQAEVGFYAVNRPYFRIIYSNVVETPRRSPSTRVAMDSDWTVSANKFAEVLDVSGFTHDAFDVAMIGDDPVAAEHATQQAFADFSGTSFTRFSPEDMRHAMYAIASGHDLEHLRWRVSPQLFATLQERSADLSPAKAVSALNEYFGTEEIDVTEEAFGPTVFGASLINFPRTLKTVRSASRYSPVSSPAGRI